MADDMEIRGGDIVICVDDGDLLGITQGRLYRALALDPQAAKVKIVDDNDVVGYYKTKRFQLAAVPYREDKAKTWLIDKITTLYNNKETANAFAINLYNEMLKELYGLKICVVPAKLEFVSV